MDLSLQPIMHFLSHHLHWAGFLTYLIAAGESMAVIGTIIPGSVTMTAVGALVGAGVLPLSATFIWAICGAFTGDCTSFWLGVHFNNRLRSMWPFRRHPVWFEKGEIFFEKHGILSVLLGRFVGPMRPMVPVVAGMLKMTTPQFILAAFPSAILWAILYITPGILVGALSLELPPGLAARFILAVLILIAVIWLLSWGIYYLVQRICSPIDTAVAKLWRHTKQHPQLQWWVRPLADPTEPDHHQQLLLLFAAFIFIVLFSFVAYSVAFHTYLVSWNDPVFYLLRSFRNRATDKLMVFISLLGADKSTLLIASLLMLAVFLYRRRFRTALHWFINLGLIGSTAWFMKHLFYSPRPNGLARAITSSHSSLASTSHRR